MSDEYITSEELLLSPYDLDPDIDPKLLTTLQTLSKSLVDDLCGKVFNLEGTAEEGETSAVYVEKKISGSGKDTIFMPKRLVELEKIRIYSSSIGYVDYTLDNFTVKPKFISWNIFSDAYDNARINVENFPIGKYNIGVFGLWGYLLPPEPIKYLQGRIIQKIMEDGKFANNFESEKIGDYNYKLLIDKNKDVLADNELDCIVRQYSDWVGYAVN